MKSILVVVAVSLGLMACTGENGGSPPAETKQQALSGPATTPLPGSGGIASAVGRIMYGSRECVGTLMYDFKTAQPSLLNSLTCFPCGAQGTFTLPQEGVAHPIVQDACHPEASGTNNAIGIAHFTSSLPNPSRYDFATLATANLDEYWQDQGGVLDPILLGFDGALNRVIGVQENLFPGDPFGEPFPSCVAGGGCIEYNIHHNANLSNFDSLTDRGAPVFLSFDPNALPQVVGVFHGDYIGANNHRIGIVSGDDWTASQLNGFTGIIEGPNGQRCTAISSGYYGDYVESEEPVRDMLTAASCVPCSGDNAGWTFTDIFTGQVFKLGYEDGERKALCYDNGIAIFRAYNYNGTDPLHDYYSDPNYLPPYAPAMNVVNFTSYSTLGLYADTLDPSTNNQFPYVNGYDDLKVTIYSVDDEGNLIVETPPSDISYNPLNGEWSTPDPIVSGPGAAWVLARGGAPILAGIQLANGNAQTLSDSFESMNEYSLRTKNSDPTAEQNPNNGSHVLHDCEGAAALQELRVNDRATVIHTTNYASDFSQVDYNDRIIVESYGYLELGADAQVGTALAAGTIFARDRARIERFGAAYGGYYQQSTTPFVAEFDQWAWFNTHQAKFYLGQIQESTYPYYTGPSTNLVLENNGDPPVTLAPGAYDRVVVRQGRKLILTPGDYYFNNLEVSPGAEIESQGSYQNTVHAHIQYNLMLNGGINGGDLDSTSWVFTGTNTVWLNSSVQTIKPGLIIAPNASVVLAGAKVLYGAIWAKKIELHQESHIVCVKWANNKPHTPN